MELPQLSVERYNKKANQNALILDEIDRDNAEILLYQEEQAAKKAEQNKKNQNKPTKLEDISKSGRGAGRSAFEKKVDKIDKDNEELLTDTTATTEEVQPPPIEEVQPPPPTEGVSEKPVTAPATVSNTLSQEDLSKIPPHLRNQDQVQQAQLIQESSQVPLNERNRLGYNLHRDRTVTLSDGTETTVGEIEDQAFSTLEPSPEILKQVPGLFELYDRNKDGIITDSDQPFNNRHRAINFLGNLAMWEPGTPWGGPGGPAEGVSPRSYYEERKLSMMAANEYGLDENLRELADKPIDGLLGLAEWISSSPEVITDLALSRFGHGRMINSDGSTNRNYEPHWATSLKFEDSVGKTTWGKFVAAGTEFGLAAWMGGGAIRAIGARSLSPLAVRGMAGHKWWALPSKSPAINVFGKTFNLLPTQLQHTLGWSQAMSYGAALHGATNPDSITNDNITARLIRAYDSPDTTGFSGLVKHGSWFEGVVRAMATKDTDSPLLLAFKNAASEYLIDQVFNVGLAAVRIDPDGLKHWEDSYTNQSLQIFEKAAAEQAQLAAKQGTTIPKTVGEEPIPPAANIRGHLNKQIVEPFQGSPSVTGKAFDINTQLNRIDDLPDGSVGSTNSVLTPAAAERMAEVSGLEPALLKEKAKELLDDVRFQELVNLAAKNNQTVGELFAGSLRRFSEIMGRNATGVEDFWRPISDLPAERLLEQEFWPLQEIVAVDLVNGALFKQLRNTSLFSKELIKGADVFAADGPMKTIADRLVVGLTNAKRSRYLWGRAGNMLRRNADPAVLNSKELIQETTERTAALHDETIDGVRLMMQLMKNSNSEEFANAILNVFSQSSKIQNWMDFDNWMRSKLRGGEFGGKTDTGALIKELQQMMVYSVLSGPKTPLRAILGTAGNAYMDSVNTLIGATVREPFGGSGIARKAAAANLSTMVKIVPDAWKVFKSNIENAFDVEMATIKTRFTGPSPEEVNWDVFGEWIEQSPNSTWADKASYRIANLAFKANKNKVFTWSARALHATDDTFKYIMANARANEKALKEVLESVDEGLYKQWTPEMLSKAQDSHYKALLNEAGDIDLTKDLYLQQRFKSATLTEDLQGISKGLEELFEKVPIMKPWFLFARTGVNGLRVTMKNAPGLGLAMKESRDVLMSSADDLANGKLIKYGIENASDLQQAKDLILGRQVFGSIGVFTAGQLYWNGNLTGNGPADGKLRQAWIDAGWKARSIRLGDVWVNYDNFEPWNLLLSSVADIGDNQALMGPEWTENHLEAVAFTLGNGLKSKSYLGGLSQLMDVISGKPSAGYGSVIGNLMNNTMPLGSLRNHIGKALRPQMLEINGSLWESIRNRNKGAELLTLGGGLPGKFDVLNGRPLGAHPLEWFSDTFLPFGLSLAKGPGRELLWNSNYDIRLSSYTLPTPYGNISLADSPQIRSLLQQAMGNQNIEADLDKLARRADVQASVKLMEHDRKNGLDKTEPRSYSHNKLIKELFTRKRNKAAASLLQHPQVQQLIREHRDGLINNVRAQEQSSAQTYYLSGEDAYLPKEEGGIPPHLLNLPVK